MDTSGVQALLEISAGMDKIPKGLTMPPDPATSKLSFKAHIVIPPEDAMAVEPALHELPFVPVKGLITYRAAYDLRTVWLWHMV